MSRIGSTLLFSVLIIFVAACSDSVASLNNEGNAQFEDKNYTEALDNYLEAQREDPDLPQPYYNAGNAHHREGNFESATTQTQQSIRSSEGELA